MKPCIVAVALVFAFACSKSGDGAPKLTDNEPAGKVTEVTGSVAAKRDREEIPRPLVKGDNVFPDHSIFTNVNSSVQIRLHHNQALLSLGEKKIRRLFGSAAWKAPKGKKVDDVGANDKLMVAGRHAERQAGETTPVLKADEEPPPDKDVAPGKVDDKKSANKNGRKTKTGKNDPDGKRGPSDKKPRHKVDSPKDKLRESGRTASERVVVHMRKSGAGPTSGLNIKRPVTMSKPLRKVVVACLAKLHKRYPMSKGTLLIRGRPRSRPAVTVTPSKDPGLRKLADCVGAHHRWPGGLRMLLRDNAYSATYRIRASK